MSKSLDTFLTLKVLENTPAVLSLGKLCDENGYSYEWNNGQKPHLIKDGIRIICNTENFVPIVVFQACQRVCHPVLIIQLQIHLQDRRGIVVTSSSSSSSPTTTSSDSETRERKD